MKQIHMRSPLRAEKIGPAGVAWYDLRGHGWFRDIAVILHPPYTLWHLSYVLIGAALAPELNWAVLGWTYLAFFLGMGIGGHCLDELNGRPLRTKISSKALWITAGISILVAIVIGVLIGVRETVWVIPCIIFGGFIVFAYNLEWGPWPLPGHTGFFHRDNWFGIAWGSFPAVTAYVAQTGTFNADILLIAIASWGYSMAQRKLSLHARFWRRKVAHVRGDYVIRREHNNKTWASITPQTIIGPAEIALKYLNIAIVAIAAGLLLMHLMKGVL